jgi:hypothetical protein
MTGEELFRYWMREETKLMLQEQQACAANDHARAAHFHRERWHCLDEAIRCAESAKSQELAALDAPKPA